MLSFFGCVSSEKRWSKNVRQRMPFVQIRSTGILTAQIPSHPVYRSHSHHIERRIPAFVSFEGNRLVLEGFSTTYALTIIVKLQVPKIYVCCALLFRDLQQQVKPQGVHLGKVPGYNCCAVAF